MLALIGAMISMIVVPFLTVIIPALHRLKVPRGHIVAIDEGVNFCLPVGSNALLAHSYKDARRYSTKGHVLLRTSDSRERAKAEFEIVTRVTNERQLCTDDCNIIKNLFDDPLV